MATFIASLVALFKWLFKLPIYSEVVRINGYLHSGHSLSVQLKNIIHFILTLTIAGRLLAISGSLLLQWNGYFNYDLFARIIFKEHGLNYSIFTAVAFGLPLLAWYLFSSFYIHPNAVIVEPFYDLVVRNFDSAYFSLSWSNFPSILNLVVPSNVHLPSFRKPISAQHRHKALILMLVLEATAYFFKWFFITAVTYLVYYYSHNRPLIEALLLPVDTVTLFYVAFYLGISLTLLMANIFLILYIYTRQYVELQKKLRCLVLGSSPSRVYQILAQYRLEHVHQTAYLLTYNEIFTAPIVLRLGWYLLPLHAYCIVLIYYQSDRLLLIKEVIQFFLLGATLILTVCATCLWLANQFITSSASELIRILTHKQRGICSTYCSERLKLANYYEQLWRVDKRLGFTCGNGGPFIDSMFIVETWLRYIAFLLYFGGNFISQK